MSFPFNNNDFNVLHCFFWTRDRLDILEFSSEILSFFLVLLSSCLVVFSSITVAVARLFANGMTEYSACGALNGPIAVP